MIARRQTAKAIALSLGSIKDQPVKAEPAKAEPAASVPIDDGTIFRNQVSAHVRAMLEPKPKAEPKGQIKRRARAKSSQRRSVRQAAEGGAVAMMEVADHSNGRGNPTG